jgi:hypothetical protein
MEPVLEFISSYENRIATVEDLMTTAYQATITSGGGFDILDEERENLRTVLQKTLAQNCSLRKKDFDQMLEKVLSQSNLQRKTIEQERNQIKGKVAKYLAEQKTLANSLRQQIVELSGLPLDKGNVDRIVENIKNTCMDKGQGLLAALKEFQAILGEFQKEQEAINLKLQRLMERGKSLNLQDLRQLKAAEALQERARDREQRRQEVGRLLTDFKQQRMASYRQQGE